MTQKVPLSRRRSILKAPFEAPYLPHIRRRASRPERKAPGCGAFAEPSDGLEPSTPSLPCSTRGNRSQPAATVWPVSALSALARFAFGCHWLQPRGSIKAPSLVITSGNDSSLRSRLHVQIEGSEAITLSEPLAERSTWPKLGPPRTDAHVLKEGAIGGGTGLD